MMVLSPVNFEQDSRLKSEICCKILIVIQATKQRHY
jgi:hypothetical protein